MAKKAKGAAEATAAILAAEKAGKNPPPLSKTAEDQNYINITSTQLETDDLMKMIDALSMRIHHRFPDCSHCGEYTKTTKRGVRLKYTPKGTKASRTLADAIKGLRKGVTDMRDGGVQYYKPAPKLVAAAKEAGVSLEVPAQGDAPDAGHAQGGTAAAPKAKRGRKPKAAAAPAPAAAAPAAAPKAKGKGKGKAAAHPGVTEAEHKALKKVKASEEVVAKYTALKTAAEREKYMNQLVAAHKGRKTRAKNAKAAEKAAPARGGRDAA